MHPPLTVVIVEDDPVFRAAFASAVLRAPALELVGAASDLPDALAMVDRERPQVVLVDIGLPSGSGLDVIRAAVATRPDCDVVMVTTLDDDDKLIAAIEAGATGYLLKDASPQDLVAQLQVLRDGGSPVSPILARRLLTRLAAAATAATPLAGSAATATEGARASLSEQEVQVLQQSAAGFTAIEIADRMGVSRHTVGTYIRRAYRKLQVRSRAQAVMQARRFGWITDPGPRSA
ncbi:MAG: response regulator [Aquabacterium sp.]